MIPGFELIEFVQTAGPLAALLLVVFIIFAENGLLAGFFLPGDSILFTVGVLLQGTKTASLDFDINLVILLLFIAATTGASVGYAFGKKIGPRLFKRPDSLLFKQENVQKAQEFYNKHGGKTIILARFIPIVRTFVPLIAGIAKMNYKTFMIYNLLGGALWAGGVTYLGYFLGGWLTSIGVDVDTVLLPIIAVILIASILPAVYEVLKDKQQRQAIWDTTKSQLKRVAKRKK
jgi:membrane-associated protein